MEQGEPKIKRLKHSIISEHMYDLEFQNIFYENWHDRTSVKTSDIEVIAEPFRVCKISNFLQSEEFMDEIKNELLDVKSRRNSIDLYQFEQSNDLAGVSRRNLNKLYEIFQTDMVSWMEKNTNIILNKNISMSSSCYSDTDYLLCHDDNLGDRRIAFVLYLSKNWTEEDGGTLDLFDTDENGLPRKVVKSLIPEYNSLVFFEVVHNSYHQVAEVTSPDKSRWSINGWFHGPLVAPQRAARSEPAPRLLEPEFTQLELAAWISQDYLYPGTMKVIQEDVERESFAFLADFLKPDVYQKLLADIDSPDVKWTRTGPADMRNYEVAVEDSLPELLADFCRLFKSITMFQLLKNYTELDLVPEHENMKPRLSIELQRWSHGCYTLIADKSDHEEEEEEPVPSAERRPPRYDPEDCSGASQSNRLVRLPSNYAEDANCHTPPSSSQGDEDEDEEGISRLPAKEKSPRTRKRPSTLAQQQQQISPSKAETTSSKRRNSDTDDSDVSDIGDYLSDPLDCSFDCSEQEDEPEPEPEPNDVEDDEEEVEEPGSLDVIMQFHTEHIKDKTIDYIDLTGIEDAALIHVPSKDNHLCLVYKTHGTCRVQKYVDHYCRGYFYNLICTYYESDPGTGSRL